MLIPAQPSSSIHPQWAYFFPFSPQVKSNICYKSLSLNPHTDIELKEQSRILRVLEFAKFLAVWKGAKWGENNGLHPQLLAVKELNYIWLWLKGARLQLILRKFESSWRGKGSKFSICPAETCNNILTSKGTYGIKKIANIGPTLHPYSYGSTFRSTDQIL